jgi:hypothetical protein
MMILKPITREIQRKRWPNSHWILDARAVPIERVIEQRGIQLKRVGKEHVGPCPRCGGHDRFSINPQKGVFNCRGCKRGGDVIDLVMHLDNVDCLGAVEILTHQRFDSITGKATTALQSRQNGDFAKRQREQQTDERRRLEYASRIWNEAIPIIGTPGEAYLNKRGIILDEVPDQGGLRWHPRCPWEKSTTPCIISRFTDVITAQPRGIHRRPIILDAKPRSLGPITSHKSTEENGDLCPHCAGSAHEGSRRRLRSEAGRLVRVDRWPSRRRTPSRRACLPR